MSGNQVSIKKKIDSVMKEEFKKMLDDSDLSPLLQMAINDELEPYNNKLDELIALLKEKDPGID